MAACWLVVVVLGLYLGTHESSSAVSQTLGDGSIFAFSLLAALACARAARASRSSSRRGWLLLTFSLSLWSAAQLMYSLYGVTSQHVYPFPSIADVGFLAYSIPALAGLFAFPRPDALLVSRVRGLLDALVIATATLFVSWATVLEPTHAAFGLDAMAGLTALAYPVVDVTICSIVLTLGMRQPPGERLLWVLLGGGLLLLAISDSVYVRLLAEGETAITGSALAVGWMAAFLLITMATFVNAPRRASPSQTSSSFGLQLIPYVPLVAAVIVATGAAYRREPFHALTGGLLLVIVIARQLVIVYENVTLTRDLEAKVAARTAELNSVNEIVKAKNEQMEAAQAIARVGSWEWRPAVGETKWSPEFYRILGLPANCTDTQSDLFMERVHPEDMAKVLDARAEVLRNPNEVQTEYRIIRPDGSIRHVQSRVAVVRDAAHDAPMLVGTMQDLTELFEVERMKDQFLSVASHELRTPLTSIRGVLGLLAGGALGPLSDQAQRMVGVAVGSSERLVRLISGILDAEKIEAGKLSLDLAEYPAAELVAAAVDEMAPLAHESGVTLTMASCEGTVHADKDRIIQALTNLLSNAVRFSPFGGGVTIAADPADDVVSFTVVDQGRGIPVDQLDKVFDRFQQVDASDTREKDGTGLGLYICRGIIEQHGGRIQAASTGKGGSTFTFTLPIALSSGSRGDLPQKSGEAWGQSPSDSTAESWSEYASVKV